MAQLNIRTTLLASFGAVAACALLLGGTTFLASGGGENRFDPSQLAFVESLAGVEGELNISVADLVARNGAEWPPTLDAAFQGFADAAANTDISPFHDQVNALLQSGQEFRDRWPAAAAATESVDDAAAVAAAVDAASVAYRDTTAAIHVLETMLVDVRMTAGADAARFAGMLRLLALGGTAACLAIVGFAGRYCLTTILGPLQAASSTVVRAAAGQLTVRIGATTARGEVAALCGSIDRLLDGTHRAISDLRQETATLATSASNLAAEARTLTEGSARMADEATETALLAESASTGLTTMGASAEDMAGPLRSIAASATELAQSVGAMNVEAKTASAAADAAAALAADSNANVAALGLATEEIGDLIQVIQDIAERTNLLALNATIEAARAGDAGKGFAVVARQVKELANQTADATGNIRQRVEAIQSSTGESAGALGRIADVIAGISSVTTTIATAVEQQNGAVQEIARSAGESASAAECIGRDMAQSAGASQEIGRSIATVGTNSQESAQSLGLVQSAAQDVAEMAESLNGELRDFTV